MDSDSAGLVEPGDRALRFEIKMFLPTDKELAGKSQRTPLHCRNVAARHPQRARQETSRRNGFLNREDRRKRLIIRAHKLSSVPCRLQRFPQHPGDRLAMKHHLRWE